MKLILLIGCGSFLGGVLRYVLSRSLQNMLGGSYPWATLSVNVLGCLALGALSAALSRHWTLPEEWRLALTVGLCGGFTTFSTFAHEGMLLFHSGGILHLFFYSLLSISLCLAAMFLGYYLVMR